MIHLDNILLDSYNPQQWSDINILPLPRDGDLSNASNYRGIGLSATMSKVMK